jgi:hypothetical protein
MLHLATCFWVLSCALLTRGSPDGLLRINLNKKRFYKETLTAAKLFICLGRRAAAFTSDGSRQYYDASNNGIVPLDNYLDAQYDRYSSIGGCLMYGIYMIFDLLIPFIADSMLPAAQIQVSQVKNLQEEWY